MTFKTGDSPGPGRGHKKPVKPLTIEQIELALQLDLKSKDPKIRHPATRLLLQLKKQQAQADARLSASDDTVIDPGIQAALGDRLDKILSGDLPEYDEDQDFLDE